MKDQKLNPWLVAAVAFLLFVVAVETGILIHRLGGSKKTNPSAVRLDTLADPDYPAAAPHPSRKLPSHAGMPFGSEDDPFAALEKIQDRMNHLFDTAMFYGPRMAQSLAGGGFDFSPAVDITETAEAYLVSGDMPGLEKDKINISVEGGMLTIQGIRETQTQKADDGSGYYSQERSYGSFARSIPLPGPVDESAVTADYKNGVLTIKLPKSKALQAAKVLVQ